MKRIITLLSACVVLLSCNNYYKAITVTNPSTGNITENLNHTNRYNILRNGNKAFAISSAAVASDGQTVQCSLATLPENHQLHLTKGRRGKMIYRQAGNEESERGVLNETHFYMVPDTAMVPGNYTLAVNQFQKIEVLQKDQKRTTKNHIITGVVITGGVLLFSAAIFSSALASITFL